MSESSELDVPPSPGRDPPRSPGSKRGSGIVRKRSVRRCISTGKEEVIPLGYGRQREKYDKIVERVLADKTVQSAVESLQERWKMILIMHEDCMNMVTEWEEREHKKAHSVDWFQLLIVIIIAVSVLIPVICIVVRFG